MKQYKKSSLFVSIYCLTLNILPTFFPRFKYLLETLQLNLKINLKLSVLYVLYSLNVAGYCEINSKIAIFLLKLTVITVLSIKMYSTGSARHKSSTTVVYTEARNHSGLHTSLSDSQFPPLSSC